MSVVKQYSRFHFIFTNVNETTKTHVQTSKSVEFLWSTFSNTFMNFCISQHLYMEMGVMKNQSLEKWFNKTKATCYTYTNLPTIWFYITFVKNKWSRPTINTFTVTANILILIFPFVYTHKRFHIFGITFSMYLFALNKVTPFIDFTNWYAKIQHIFSKWNRSTTT